MEAAGELGGRQTWYEPERHLGLQGALPGEVLPQAEELLPGDATL